MMPEKQPRVAVFCRCGAAWYGKHTVENPEIPKHERECGAFFSAALFIHPMCGGVIKWPAHWSAAERREAAYFADKVAQFGMPLGW